MAVANGTQQHHEPAWKRIGLKLKYANDVPQPTSNLEQSDHSEPKPAKETGSHYQDLSDQSKNERPSKKRKIASRSDHAANSSTKPVPEQALPEKDLAPEERGPNRVHGIVRASVETEPAIAAQEQADNNSSETRAEPEKPRIKSIKRRKSVTFTGETKQNDGNSAESGVEPIIASNLGESAGPSSETTEPDEPISKKTKKSKDKSNAASENLNSSEQSTKAKTSVSSDLNTAPIPEYVRYLELFHHDKKSWKFNKNHQTALLKNIFDLHKIPSTLTTAVIGYVSGLKGASPRQRLAKDAKAILKSFAEKDGSLDEIVEMNTESARREAYFKAMHKAIEKWEAAGMPRSQYDDEQIEDMEMEMERGKRAEAVLRALPLIEPSTQSSTPSTRPATLEASPAASTSRTNTSPDTSMTSTSQSKRTSRKRKQRTDVSSNSSSSSSDSSSDSSDDETNTPPKPTHKEPQTVSQALRGPPAPPKVPAVRTPAYQHDNLNMSYRPQNPSQLMNMSAKPTKKFFDDELLDAAFPKKKTYHETAPKRRKVDGEGKQRARGFAYTHGTKVDESGSEDEG